MISQILTLYIYLRSTQINSFIKEAAQISIADITKALKVKLIVIQTRTNLNKSQLERLRRRQSTLDIDTNDANTFAPIEIGKMSISADRRKQLDAEAVQNFREYLRIPSVHPDINYGKLCG